MTWLWTGARLAGGCIPRTAALSAPQRTERVDGVDGRRHDLRSGPADRSSGRSLLRKRRRAHRDRWSKGSARERRRSARYPKTRARSSHPQDADWDAGARSSRARRGADRDRRAASASRPVRLRARTSHPQRPPRRLRRLRDFRPRLSTRSTLTGLYTDGRCSFPSRADSRSSGYVLYELHLCRRTGRCGAGAPGIPEPTVPRELSDIALPSPRIAVWPAWSRSSRGSRPPPAS